MQRRLEDGALFPMARKQRQIEEATIVIAGLKFPMVARARGCSASIASILQWSFGKMKQKDALFACARDDLKRLYNFGVPGSCCWVPHADFGCLCWGEECDFGDHSVLPGTGSCADEACDCGRGVAEAAAEASRRAGVESLSDSHRQSDDSQSLQPLLTRFGLPGPSLQTDCDCTGASAQVFQSLCEATLDNEFYYYTAHNSHEDTLHAACFHGFPSEHDFHSTQLPGDGMSFQLGRFGRPGEDGRDCAGASTQVFQSLCEATLDEEFYSYTKHNCHDDTLHAVCCHGFSSEHDFHSARLHGEGMGFQLGRFGRLSKGGSQLYTRAPALSDRRFRSDALQSLQPLLLRFGLPGCSLQTDCDCPGASTQAFQSMCEATLDEEFYCCNEHNNSFGDTLHAACFHGFSSEHDFHSAQPPGDGKTFQLGRFGRPGEGGSQLYIPDPALPQTTDQARRAGSLSEDPRDSKEDPQRAKNIDDGNGRQVPPSTEVEIRPAEGQKFPRSRAFEANPEPPPTSLLKAAPGFLHSSPCACHGDVDVSVCVFPDRLDQGGDKMNRAATDDQLDSDGDQANCVQYPLSSGPPLGVSLCPPFAGSRVACLGLLCEGASWGFEAQPTNNQCWAPPAANSACLDLGGDREACDADGFLKPSLSPSACLDLGGDREACDADGFLKPSLSPFGFPFGFRPPSPLVQGGCEVSECTPRSVGDEQSAMQCPSSPDAPLGFRLCPPFVGSRVLCIGLLGEQRLTDSIGCPSVDGTFCWEELVDEGSHGARGQDSADGHCKARSQCQAHLPSFGGDEPGAQEHDSDCASTACTSADEFGLDLQPPPCVLWQCLADELFYNNDFADELCANFAQCLTEELWCADPDCNATPGNGDPSDEPRANATPVTTRTQAWFGVDRSWWGWARLPSNVIQHCYLLATRVGEASNPGPDQAIFDVGSLLGPNFGAMLQNFIQQQIQIAVQSAVQAAMQQLQIGLPAQPSQIATEATAQAPRRKRKGKGEGAVPAGGAPQAGPTAEAGKGKANGKSKPAAPGDAARNPRSGGRGTEAVKPRSKGKGGAPTGAEAHTSSGKDAWTLVTRKQKSEDPFELRQQDWNAPLISCAGLAQRLQDTAAADVCRAVILCPGKELATIQTLLQGTAKKFACLLIVLAKDHPGPTKDLKAQQVPGKAGLRLLAQDAFVIHACSEGQTAPQPVGISSVPQKVATKATAILFVKVPKAYADAQTWKGFVERPQRQMAQWTAQHHVLCIDCFSWAEEVLKGGRRQVYGIIRIALADVSTLLSRSGDQGVFLQPPRDKTAGQHILGSQA